MSKTEKAFVNGREVGTQALLAALRFQLDETLHLTTITGRTFEIPGAIWNELLDAADAQISASRISVLRAAEANPAPRKCIVKGCQNHINEGTFIGDLCVPCHHMLTTGQAYYTENFIGGLQRDSTQLQSIKSLLHSLLQEKQP